MSAQFRALSPKADLEVQVEQAIARRCSVLQIMIELDISYEQYRIVKDRLDASSMHKDAIGEPANLRRAG
jgi:hypothetical protein